MAIERPDPRMIAEAVARADLERRGVAKGAVAGPARKAVEARARELLWLAEAITDALYGPAGPVAKSIAGGVRSLADAVGDFGESLRRVHEQDVLRRAENALRMDRIRERIAAPGQQAQFGDVDAARVAEFQQALKTAGLTQVPHVNGAG
jgi:hypothetical protein